MENDRNLFTGHIVNLTTDSSDSNYQIRRTLDELIITEEIFVKEICDVIKGYMDRVVNMKEVPKEIFGNIRELYDFNSIFLGNLKKCNSVADVSHVFLEKSSGFHKLYSEYCQNFPQAMVMIKNCLKNPLLDEYFSFLQIELDHKLPFSSYLLKPVQRISKYHLFFQNIVKYRVGNHEEIVRKALQCMTQILKYIDQTQYKNMNHHLQNKITSMDTADFGDLILKDKLFMNSSKSKVYLHIFLFTKVVLIAKKKNKNKFLVKIMFKAEEANVIYDISPHHPLSFFIANNLQFICHLQAIDFEQKHCWCFNLQRVLSPLVINPFLISDLRNYLIESDKANNNEKQIRKVKSEYLVHENKGKKETCMKFEQIYLLNMSKTLKESHLLSFNEILEKGSCLQNYSTDFDDKSILEQIDLPVEKSSISKCLEKQDKSGSDFVNYKKKENPESLQLTFCHTANYLFTLKISKTNLKNKFILSYKEAKCDDVVLDGCSGIYRKLPEKHEIPITTPYFEDKVHDKNSYTFLDFFYEDKLLDKLERPMKDYKNLIYYDDDDDECFYIKNDVSLDVCSESLFNNLI